MLLVVLIAIVALVALAFAGDEVSEMWSQTSSGLEGARAIDVMGASVLLIPGF